MARWEVNPHGSHITHKHEIIHRYMPMCVYMCVLSKFIYTFTLQHTHARKHVRTNAPFPDGHTHLLPMA